MSLSSTGAASFANTINVGTTLYVNSTATIAYSGLSGDFGAGYTTGMGVGYSSSVSKGINMGWNTTYDMGFIGTVHNGTAWKNLSLCPVGGAVYIGITGGSPIYAGNITATGDITANAGSATAITVYNASSIRAKLSMTGNEGDLSLYGSSANRLVYLSAYYDSYVNGKISVGTTTNTNQNLTVYSATGAGQVRIGGVAPTIYFTDILSDPANYIALVGLATQTNNFFTGTAAGDFVMYNAASGFNLYVVNYSGGVYLTSGATSWTANSDIRLKNINSHIENAVEKLSTLQTINFSYKDDKFKKQNLGLIAQEVEKIFPELIDKNNDGMLGVRYTELVPVLIKAIQELKLEIETLKNK